MGVRKKSVYAICFADRKSNSRQRVSSGYARNLGIVRILIQEAKPHELEGKNQGDRRGRLHLAVAAWDPDSDTSSYLPAPGLHLRGVKKG
jgi:hypothetical protein